jgi:hypothetical protein
MAMQTPTRLFPALISRGLMLFSITDSATRSFSAGRVTPRQPKDAWPRQRVNSWQPSTSPRAFHFFCLFAQVVDVIAPDDNSSTPVKIAGSLAYSTPMNLKKLLWTSIFSRSRLSRSQWEPSPSIESTSSPPREDFSFARFRPSAKDKGLLRAYHH